MNRSNRSHELVGTAEVARALGVSVSTIKRWIDDGVLPAARSAGGHRRMRPDDVARAVRRHGLPAADLSALAARRGTPIAALRRQVLGALVAGREARLSALFSRARAAGLPVAALGDELVAPAMAAIGERWKRGELDIGHEHRATAICTAALHEVRAALPAPSSRRIALGGGPEGDPYVLANLLAEMVLTEAGWRAVNLGPDTPFEAFAAAVARLRPSLIWLSIGHVRDASRLTREYRALARQAARCRAAVVVGGRALTPALRQALEPTWSGRTMSELSAFTSGSATGQRLTF